MPSFLGSILIPAAGTALGLGSVGGYSTIVTALGIAGATGIGVGALLQNKDREAIYVTGAEGVQCLLNNMQPYTYIQPEKLKELNAWLGLLEIRQRQLNQLVTAVGAEPQLDKCDAHPNPALTYRAQALTAGKEALKAASKTSKIGFSFLTTAHDSPLTIVNTVDKINNGVSSALIKTEADVKSLASNLKGVIPDNATALAGVPSAKADTETAKTDSPGLSKPKSKAAEGGGGGGTARSGGKARGARAAQAETAQAETEQAPIIWPESSSNAKQQSITSTLSIPLVSTPPSTLDEQLAQMVNEITFTMDNILDIVGSNTSAPNNDSCPTLVKKAGEVKTLTFNPDGDIVVSKGSKATVAVLGAQAPYVRPTFREDDPPTISATLNEGQHTTIDIAVTKDIEPGFYPYFVGDGPTGKLLNVEILGPRETTCPPKPEAKTKKVQRCCFEVAPCASTNPSTCGNAHPAPTAMPTPMGATR